MSFKTKMIEKDRKLTRNQKRKIEKQKQKQFRQKNHPKTNIFARGKQTINPKNKIKLQNIEAQKMQDQNIVVNLNLGQYGFDYSIKAQSYLKLQQVVGRAQIFSINPNIENLQWKDLCSQMTKVMKNQNFLISFKGCHVFYDSRCQKLIQINQNEYQLWKYMHQLFTKIKYECNSPGLIGKAKNIIFRSRKKSEEFNQIKKFNQIIQYRKDLQSQLIFKTFIIGLQELQIDKLNYFLDVESAQNRKNRNQKNQKRINNLKQWSQFIKKKRVRLRKANKFILHTACQLCLSSYSQLSNNFINCNQCHLRGHRLCFQFSQSNRCGRCVYLRLPNQVKAKIPQCIFCCQRNLVPIKLPGNRFSHLFCLIAHGQLQRMILQNNSLPSSIKAVQIQEKACKFCGNFSKFNTICKNCDSYCHYLCAFMNGARFQINDRQIKVMCCGRDKEQERLGQDRKYILNYNNVVFKKLAEVQQLLKKKKRRYKNGQQLFQQAQPNQPNMQEMQQIIPNYQNNFDESFQQGVQSDENQEGQL